MPPAGEVVTIRCGWRFSVEDYGVKTMGSDPQKVFRRTEGVRPPKKSCDKQRGQTSKKVTEANKYAIMVNDC